MASILHSVGDRSLRSLVDLEHGLISREIYINPDIYAQELELVYGRAWLFIGHESLVPNRGDFFQGRMGEETVILVRDHKDQLHVFLNTCRHRGMKVCRYDDGNTRLFTCPFHGFSYDTDGKLVGVPHFKAAFHEEFDKSAFGLHEVAQMCNYYGSIWATWDPKAPSFVDYLGGFAQGIRRCFEGTDGSDNGVEFFKPVQKWRLPSNWKFPGFSFDGDHLHGVTTHRSINVAAIGPQGDTNEGDRHPLTASFPSSTHEMSSRKLGHGGHNSLYDQTGVRPYRDTWQTEPPEVDEYYRKAWAARERKYEGQYRHEGRAMVFPNVNIQEQRILLWHPHGVGGCESWRFYTVDRGAPQVVRDAQRHYMMRYCGPVGLTESDDMENWNYASAASGGTIARRLPYPFKAGLGHDYTDERAPGMTLNFRIAEENQRSRLSRWLDFMEAGSWDELYPNKQ